MVKSESPDARWIALCCGIALCCACHERSFAVLPRERATDAEQGNGEHLPGEANAGRSAEPGPDGATPGTIDSGMLSDAAMSDAALDSGQDAALEDATVPIDATMDAGPRPDIAIAKWYGNHTAAVSLNLDGDINASPGVVELVQEHHVALDCELVTGTLTPDRIADIQDRLIPAGITFFGHGQAHNNHDSLTEEEAFASAQSCFQTMIDIGLTPVSFAYPGGHGTQAETQRAIAAAGFLSARGHNATSNPYIVPDDRLAPSNWFLLPDVVMESYDYQQASNRTNDTEELSRFLDGALERTAWIIVTYHAIGRPDLFGFYYLSDFASDLDAISARDLWPASLDAATLYVRERENATASITRSASSISVYLDDGLPNDRFTQPLTLLFEIPEAWVGVPLQIEDDTRRWPDQTATSSYAALSFPPFEREYHISPATTPYEPDPAVDPDPGPDQDAGR